MWSGGLVRKTTRKDLPVVHPYARGSLQRIGLAAESPHNSLLVNFEQADETFFQDRFAKSSEAPRESRWATWQRLCHVRKVPALPVMAESFHAVCSLLKAGKYRLSAQYVSVAKCKHVEPGFSWTQELDLVRQQAIRSVSRCLGTARLQLDLQRERASSTFTEEPESRGFRTRGPAVVAASWCPLRGIELANVQCEDVSFNKVQ